MIIGLKLFEWLRGFQGGLNEWNLDKIVYGCLKFGLESIENYPSFGRPSMNRTPKSVQHALVEINENQQLILLGLQKRLASSKDCLESIQLLWISSLLTLHDSCKVISFFKTLLYPGISTTWLCRFDSLQLLFSFTEAKTVTRKEEISNHGQD